MTSRLLLALFFSAVSNQAALPPAVTGPVFNPGLVLRVHKNKLAEIIQVAIPIANPLLKNVMLNETISVSVLKIYKTNMTLEDIKSDHVSCKDLSQAGHLTCEIRDTRFHMVSTARIDAFIFKSDGIIHADGVIPIIRLRIAFQDFNATHYGKPYVNLELEELEFDKKALKIHLDFKNIPSSLINTIVDLFKSVLVKNLRDSIKKFFKASGNGLINKAIEKNFPVSVPIPPLGVSLQTALNSKPVIDEHDVAIGIDGTFFVTSQGYKRDKDAQKVEGDALANYFGDVSLTAYTLNSLHEALRGREIAFNVAGVDLVVKLEGSGEIRISPKGIEGARLGAMVRGTKGKTFVEGKMNVSALLWLGIHKSYDFFLDTDLQQWSINSFDFNSNLPVVHHLGKLIPYLINTYVHYFHKLSLDIPDVILPFDLKVKDLGLVLTEQILQVGVSVQIDHVTRLIQAWVDGVVEQSQPVTSEIF